MQTTEQPYNHDIDVMKALLVIGMIVDHAVILLADNHVRTITEEFKTLIALVSFSGFLFCFGYTTWLAYFSKAPTLQRVLPSAIRPLVAYYISAYFYGLFVERTYGNSDLGRILFLNELAPFAEFLLAFSLVLVIGFLLQKPIARLLENPRPFFAVSGVLLLTALIPSGWVRWPVLSLFFSAPKEVASSFPVLPYFPLYLMGMYFARYKIKPNGWIGLVGMAGFYACKFLDVSITRFPPSVLWIFGSVFFVMVWYAVSRLITRWPPVGKWLAPIGVNTLFYLLVSNVLIFAFRGAMPKLGGAMNFKVTLEVTFGMIAVIYFLTGLVRNRSVKTPPTETSRSA
jgi:hypothetical protein